MVVLVLQRTTALPRLADRSFWGEQDNPRQRTAALARLADRSLWDLAVKSLAEFKEAGWKLDAIACSTVLSALHRSAQWSATIGYLARMHADGPWPDTISHNAALTACGRRSRWETGGTILAKVRNAGAHLTPTLVTFNAAIAALEQAGKWKLACTVLGQASDSGLTPNVISFSTAISACIGPDSVLRLLDEMETRAVAPNAVTYSAAINVCEKAGAWELALRLMGEMRSSKLEPNTITCNVLVSVCEKSVQWGRAGWMLDTMRGMAVESDIISYNSALRATAAMQAWSRAMYLLESAQDANLETDVISHSTAMAAGGGLHLEWALSQLDIMRDRMMEPDKTAYDVAFAVCYERLTAWDHAVGLLLDMGERGIEARTGALNWVLRSFSAGGRWREAMSHLEAYQRHALDPDRASYRIMENAMQRVGLRELADSMQRQGVRAGLFEGTVMQGPGGSFADAPTVTGAPLGGARPSNATRSPRADGQRAVDTPDARSRISSLLRQGLGRKASPVNPGDTAQNRVMRAPSDEMKRRRGRPKRNSPEKSQKGSGSSSSSSLAAMRAAVLSAHRLL